MIKKHNSFCLAETLLHILIEQGIEHVILSPGFRSSPLIWALSQLKKKIVKEWVIDDEGQAAFLGLMIAKCQQQPVLLICTSGTAPFHFFPALIEAHQTATPLIVVSADRPFALQECGADQTVNQNHIYGNFARTLSLRMEDPTLTSDICARKVQRFLQKEWLCGFSPLHINVSFEDLFWDDRKGLKVFPNLFYDQKQRNFMFLDRDKFQYFCKNMRQKRGLILVGENGALTENQKNLIKNCSYEQQIPIFVDVFSGLFSEQDVFSLKDLSVFLEDNQVDYVIHFGRRIALTYLLEYFKNGNIQHYAHVGEHEIDFVDPYGLVTERFLGRPVPEERKGRTFTNIHLNPKEKDKDLSFLGSDDLWRIYQEAISEAQEGTCFFVSNSNSLRIVSLLQREKLKNSFFYGHRGANGIDGHVSSVWGMAIAREQPVVAFLGDKAFAHDIGAFLFLQKYFHKIQNKVIFIVINNGGGRIFEKFSKHIPSEALNKYFISEGMYEFSFLEKIKGLSYYKIKCANLFLDHYQKVWEHEKVSVIEVCLDRRSRI